MTWTLITHPYHRGGVTSWMMDFFMAGSSASKSVKLVTSNPKVKFISALDKSPIVKLLNSQKDIIAPLVDFRFELGNFSSKVAFYKKTIQKNVPIGSFLIPSDDEAAWQACSEIADNYRMIGVLHSDDPYYYHLATKYAPYVSGFVSVSNRIKKNTRLSINHEVIPCGINISESFIPNQRKKQLVFVGRIEEKQKRISDLPKFLKRVLQLDPAWKLLIIGDGIDLPQLKEAFDNQKLSKSVHFLGWVSNMEVRNILQSSRILIQTSNYEGMSVAVMEALSAGCQVLSSEVSGVEDLALLSGAESIVSIFPIGDINAAIKGFEKLNSEYSENTAHQSYQLAKDQFSIESCWDRYEQFCQELKPVAQANKSSFNLAYFSDLLAFLRLTKYKILN